MSIANYPSLRVNGGELHWDSPDKDSTFNQIEIHKASAKYGTYTLLTTITTITTRQYVDVVATSVSWFKIRFKDSTNTIYSQYSLSISASGRQSDTNYTTPKKVAEFLGAFRRQRAESIGTGDTATKTFNFPTADRLPIQETEKVYLAGVEKIRNVDYTIDYDYGKITFTAAPAAVAITADYWASTYASTELYIDSIRRAEDEMDRRIGRTFYQPERITEYLDSYDAINSSEFSYEASNYEGDANLYKPNTFSPLTSRLIKLKSYPLITLHQLIINAQPTSVSTEAVGTGDGATKAFNLDYTIIVYGSEVIYVDGVQVTAYTIDYSTGIVTFTVAPALAEAITADYIYCTGGTIVSASNYLLRPEDGMIILKSASVPINQNPLICAATYTHGHYDLPPLIERIATKTAAIDLIQTTQMSSDSPLSIQASNIGVILGEIRSHYDAIGRKMTLTRI